MLIISGTVLSLGTGDPQFTAPRLSPNPTNTPNHPNLPINSPHPKKIQLIPQQIPNLLGNTTQFPNLLMGTPYLSNHSTSIPKSPSLPSTFPELPNLPSLPSVPSDNRPDLPSLPLHNNYFLPSPPSNINQLPNLPFSPATKDKTSMTKHKRKKLLFRTSQHFGGESQDEAGLEGHHKEHITEHSLDSSVYDHLQEIQERDMPLYQGPQATRQLQQQKDDVHQISTMDFTHSFKVVNEINKASKDINDKNKIMVASADMHETGKIPVQQSVKAVRYVKGPSITFITNTPKENIVDVPSVKMKSMKPFSQGPSITFSKVQNEEK